MKSAKFYAAEIADLSPEARAAGARLLAPYSDLTSRAERGVLPHGVVLLPRTVAPHSPLLHDPNAGASCYARTAMRFAGAAAAGDRAAKTSVDRALALLAAVAEWDRDQRDNATNSIALMDDTRPEEIRR